ncbi:MAG: hypothetical protein PUJ85_00090, partial [bacterium]|nr:hypothetical protein [bacterium]
MSLIDKLYKKRYNVKNYKKYCKDATSTFVYVTVYLSYNENLSELPEFVKNVYYITTFLADTLNSSMYLFFYDEEHSKSINEVRHALEEAKMEEALSIFNLAVQTFENVIIDRTQSIEYLKDNVPLNVQYNVNFYEEELAKL